MGAIAETTSQGRKRLVMQVDMPSGAGQTDARFQLLVPHHGHRAGYDALHSNLSSNGNSAESWPAGTLHEQQGII
jgi:hypothetical protein